jgi:hypothetical protein
LFRRRLTWCRSSRPGSRTAATITGRCATGGWVISSSVGRGRATCRRVFRRQDLAGAGVDEPGVCGDEVTLANTGSVVDAVTVRIEERRAGDGRVPRHATRGGGSPGGTGGQTDAALLTARCGEHAQHEEAGEQTDELGL